MNELIVPLRAYSAGKRAFFYIGLTGLTVVLTSCAVLAVQPDGLGIAIAVAASIVLGAAVVFATKLALGRTAQLVVGENQITIETTAILKMPVAISFADIAIVVPPSRQQSFQEQYGEFEAVGPVPCLTPYGGMTAELVILFERSLPLPIKNSVASSTWPEPSAEWRNQGYTSAGVTLFLDASNAEEVAERIGKPDGPFPMR